MGCHFLLRDLPDPGVKPVSLASLALAGRFCVTVPPENPLHLRSYPLLFITLLLAHSNPCNILHITMAGSISAHFILRNSVDSMILLGVVINALNMLDQPESTK